MTGAEVAGAAMVGKVVRNVGKETADERKAVNKELREGAKDSPYMEDASNSYAKRVAIRQALMTQMYSKTNVSHTRQRLLDVVVCSPQPTLRN